MKSKRNILFVGTVLAFFVTAPIVTLYTAGFRYQWKKQKIERVGFFETSTVPTGADVRLDDAAVGKTPYVDMGILPGTYSLALSKPGYRPYATTFDVRSGLSTLLLNVLLWKDAKPEMIASASDSAVLDPTGTSIAWIETIPNGEAAMVSLASGEKRRLACVLKNGTAPHTEWNNGASAVLFAVTTPTGIDGCVTTLTGNTYTLSDAIGTPVRSVSWSPFDNSHLLVRTDAGGVVVAYERKERKVVTATNIPFTIRGSKLYGIRATASGAELFADSVSTLPLNFGPDKVVLPPGEYTFLTSPEKYLVLREARHGRIDVYETSSLKRLATAVADSVVFEPTSSADRFLAMNGYELSLYDLKAETSRLIIRYSDPITHAIWHPLGSYAIVHSGGTIIALPFDRSSEEAVTLAHMTTAQSLWTDKSANTLLILGTEGATTGLWKLTLKE
jgi:hypothetical protein